MITKDILIQLLNVHLWDIVDKFMVENNECFTMVNNIYETCKADTYFQYPHLKELIVLTCVFVRLTKNFYNFILLINTPEFARDYTFSIYLDELYVIAMHYELYKILGIPMYVYYNFLQERDHINGLFISRLSTYIMEEYSKGNLSIEFIEFLNSLLI